MRTDWNFLTKPIANENDALDYIGELVDKNLDYHLDDDVFDILWTDYHPTKEELVLMDTRQNELFDIDGFDPHEFPVDMYELSSHIDGIVSGIKYTINYFHIAPRYYREENPLEGNIMVNVSINMLPSDSLVMLRGCIEYQIMMDIIRKINVVTIVILNKKLKSN